MIADQPVRIARALVLLVVAERDESPHAHVLRGAALQDLVPDDGVAPHHLPLGVVELALLQQDMVGDADLADVVQRRGELDGLRLVVFEAERPGDQARVARHADQVIAGLLIAELARPRKPQQRFLFPLAHVLGRVLDHVLEQAPPVLERELLAAQRQQVPAARQAFARVDRLGQEVGDPGIERRVTHLAVVVHRHHHDRHVLVAGERAQALHELDAVHVRHHVIDEHQVGNVPRRPDHGVHGTCEAFHADALVYAANHLLQDRAAGRLVVDDHHRVARRRQHPHLRLGHDPPLGTIQPDEPTPRAPGCPAKKAAFSLFFSRGAGRETRTLMVLPPADFESAASTGSAIPAGGENYNPRACSSPSSTMSCPRS